MQSCDVTSRPITVAPHIPFRILPSACRILPIALTRSVLIVATGLIFATCLGTAVTYHFVRPDQPVIDQQGLALFGSSLKAGHGLPPITAGIAVWLDGVGRAGTYGTAERMNGRTRLHRCREGVPINNCAMVGVLVRIGSRRQDTKCVVIS